jgi:uncharacterized RDD family membrane protein YckC
MEDWYYSLAGQRYGPFSLAQLHERLRALPPDTLVWHEELTTWMPAHAVPETATPLGPGPAAATVDAALYSAALSSGDYAPWLLRAGSMLLDQAIVFGPPVVGLALARAVGLTDDKGDPKGAGLVIWVITLVAGIGLGVWNRVFRDGTTGRSLGREATGTRLVGLATGQPIGMVRAFVRQLAHALDALFCLCVPIGFLWPLWDDQRQTFADKVVGTVVIREGAAPEIV